MQPLAHPEPRSSNACPAMHGLAAALCTLAASTGRGRREGVRETTRGLRAMCTCSERGVSVSGAGGAEHAGVIAVARAAR